MRRSYKNQGLDYFAFAYPGNNYLPQWVAISRCSVKCAYEKNRLKVQQLMTNKAGTLLNTFFTDINLLR